MHTPYALRSLAFVATAGAVMAAGARPAAANEPPSVPALDHPSDQSGATTTTPTDPDGDSVSYDVEVLPDGIVLDAVAADPPLPRCP